MIKVLGIKIIDRIKEAGLIILELKGAEEERLLLEKDLKALKNVHVRTMVF